MCRIVPVLVLSIRGDAAGEWTLRWYRELLQTALILRALRTTAVVALIVGVVAPVLGLLAALSIRELGIPRFILLAMLLPLFIPGVSMGLASALLFRLIGIPPSLPTIVIVQVSVGAALCDAHNPDRDGDLRSRLSRGGLRRRRRPVAGLPRHRISADRTRDLWRRKLLPDHLDQRDDPHERCAGAWNTIPTYIWSTYKQVGLSPVLYALMGLIIMSTIVLALSYLVLTRSRASRG